MSEVCARAHSHSPGRSHNCRFQLIPRDFSYLCQNTEMHFIELNSERESERDSTTIVQRVIYGYRIKYMSEWYVGFGTPQYHRLWATTHFTISFKWYLFARVKKASFLLLLYWNWKDGCRCNVALRLRLGNFCFSERGKMCTAKMRSKISEWNIYDTSVGLSKTKNCNQKRVTVIVQSSFFLFHFYLYMCVVVGCFDSISLFLCITFPSPIVVPLLSTTKSMHTFCARWVWNFDFIVRKNRSRNV